MVTKSEDKTAFNLVLEFSSSLPRPLSSPSHCFLRECFHRMGEGRAHKVLPPPGHLADSPINLLEPRSRRPFV